MSYAVYTTDGWILSSAPTGEASKLYVLYTEDFGLIRAKAQGVRLMQSKLRYNLDDYAFCAFSLVKGKDVWRLTGAEKFEVDSDPLMRARVLNLVRRLVHGEEKSEAVFASLERLKRGDSSEISIVSRLLSSLGYLDPNALEGKTDREAILIINKALKESQL